MKGVAAPKKHAPDPRQLGVATLRRSVGGLQSLRPPLTPFSSDYYDQLLSAQEDVLGRRVMDSGNERSLEAVAGMLPTLDSYTFLGTIASKQKVIVLLAHVYFVALGRRPQRTLKYASGRRPSRGSHPTRFNSLPADFGVRQSG